MTSGCRRDLIGAGTWQGAARPQSVSHEAENADWLRILGQVLVEIVSDDHVAGLERSSGRVFPFQDVLLPFISVGDRLLSLRIEPIADVLGPAAHDAFA
jgi:hypothetical protein